MNVHKELVNGEIKINLCENDYTHLSVDDTRESMLRKKRPRSKTVLNARERIFVRRKTGGGDGLRVMRRTMVVRPPVRKTFAF